MKWLNKYLYLVFAWFLTLFAYSSFSQNHNIPLNKTYSFSYDRSAFFSNSIIHNSFSPINEGYVQSVDSTIAKQITPLQIQIKKNKSFVSRKLFHEHYISLDTNSIQLTIDPLINFEVGKDLVEETNRDVSLYYINSRGFNVKMNIGEKFSFESSFRENQAVLPYYVDQRTKETQVAFGQGRWKTFGDNGYDYAMASGYISYSPKNWINLQAGHGKHFVGNGYRSLLLSDLSFNYPYLRLNTVVFNNKVQYQSLFSAYQNLVRLKTTESSEGLFERKQASTHYIEYNPNHKISFSLFESIMFPSLDSSGNRSIGANYWVPLIGLNSLIEGEKELGNSLLGTNMSIKLFNRFLLYNQLAVVGYDFNELSAQIGAKIYIGKNFLFQTEANIINEDTSFNNMFHHYNESLTHPFNQNINELIGLVMFQKNRFASRLSYHKFKNTSIDVDLLDFRQSFLINPSFNFAVNAGLRYRLDNSENGINMLHTSSPVETKNETVFIYFSLSTNLQNLYFDY